jgi:hypothetical protein
MPAPGDEPGGKVGDAGSPAKVDTGSAMSGALVTPGPSDAGPPPAPPKAVLDCNAISKDLMPTGAVKNCDRSLPKLYCDGRVLALLAVKPTVPMLLGMGPGMKDPLPADLDVVRFYDRVLTATEIVAHAKKEYEPCKAGSGCAVELDFDAQEGGGWKDTGPHGVPAKINGEVKTVPGVQGNAAHFDGKGFLEIPHHAGLVFAKTFSFEAWIKTAPGCLPGATCEFMRIFDKSDSLRLDRHAGGLRFQNTAWWFHGPGIEEKRGVWIHLAVTFDHERGVVYYRDGRENKSCRL